jgi:hypothetical protein
MRVRADLPVLAQSRIRRAEGELLFVEPESAGNSTIDTAVEPTKSPPFRRAPVMRG